MRQGLFVSGVVMMVATITAERGVVYGAEGDGRLVHLLVVADTNDPRIGKHVSTDKINVVGTLEAGLPAGRRSIKVLEGDEATPENVIAALKNLQVDPADTILFYYAGHGAIDDKLGHVLTMQTANLSRNTVVKLIQEKQARLNVILTDCCSIFEEIPVAFAPGPVNSDTVRYLLLRHEGTMDLTAADLGKPAYGNQYGGIFTNAVFQLFTLPPESIDADQDAVPTWAEAWERVKASVETDSKDLLARDKRLRPTAKMEPLAQQPHAFATASRSVGSAFVVPADRLGLTLKTTPAGVQVTAVKKDSLADWYEIRVGDSLLEMNGEKIDTHEKVPTIRKMFVGDWPQTLVMKIQRDQQEPMTVMFAYCEKPE
ncbi:hypothetical protein [Planctomicrobium sp. SH664]|uniref:hypothetical protein n=1 Tax=Planctomicrobium sp. SH664 TaxID=3448125 RepID=UPI003F5B48CB